jgi:hypothetical protein
LYYSGNRIVPGLIIKRVALRYALKGKPATPKNTMFFQGPNRIIRTTWNKSARIWEKARNQIFI